MATKDKDLEAQFLLYTVQGMVMSLPAEDRDKVTAAADRINAVAAELGELGVVALTLASAQAGAGK